jgi:hypothetical protein
MRRVQYWTERLGRPARWLSEAEAVPSRTSTQGHWELPAAPVIVYITLPLGLLSVVRRCQAHRQDNAPCSGPPDRRPQAHWHASAAALAAWARIQRPTCAPGPTQNPSLPALRPLSVATSPRAKSASKLTGSHCRPDPGHSLRLVSCGWSCFRVCRADFRARRPGHPPGPAGSGPMSPPQAAGPHAHPRAGGGRLFVCSSRAVREKSRP